ncbi:MAG TPA: DUF4126 family protein [Pyrinomonadaceae bacterium]|jgi:uncharacterized membrane protein|nr:DUF4126 family protein [Pyrinomonadaceae bacterium]
MTVSLIAAILIIGFSAGLRTFTAPAVVAWAVHVDHLDVSASPLSFMSSHTAVLILSLGALVEYVVDVLPFTPPRTKAPGLIARFVTGSFAAACLLAASGQSLAFCILGGLAAIGGAFVGYEARTRAVRSLNIKDVFVAVPEDIIAIGLSIVAVCLVP